MATINAAPVDDHHADTAEQLLTAVADVGVDEPLVEIAGQHTGGGRHISRAGRLHRRQRTNAQKADEPGRDILQQHDQHRHNLPLRSRQLHDVTADLEHILRVSGFQHRRIGAQHVSAHALNGGEDDEDEADAERRGPYLLRSERTRVLIGERPHRKRRRRLNAHQREHVSQYHHAGPGAALSLGSGAHPLDDPWDGDVMAVPVGRAFGIDRCEVGDPLLQRAPAADVAEGDDADGQDPARQQDALHRVYVRHRAQAAGRYVDDDHRREQPHTGFDRHQTVGDDVEQKPRGSQLNAEIRDREKERDDDRQHAHDIGHVVVRKHLTGGDVAETLAQHPLAFEKHHTGEGNRNGVERGVRVLKTIAIDQARMPHERPARKTGRGRRQHKDPDRNRSAGDEVVRRRFRGSGPLDPPKDAIGPVRDHEQKYPRGRCQGVLLICRSTMDLVEIRLQPRSGREAHIRARQPLLADHGITHNRTRPTPVTATPEAARSGRPRGLTSLLCFAVGRLLKRSELDTPPRGRGRPAQKGGGKQGGPSHNRASITICTGTHRAFRTESTPQWSTTCWKPIVEDDR